MSIKLANGAEKGIEIAAMAAAITVSAEEKACLASHIFTVGEESRGVVDFSGGVTGYEEGGVFFDLAPYDEVDNSGRALRDRLSTLRAGVKDMRDALKMLDMQLKALTRSLIDTDSADFYVNSIREQRKTAQIWGGSPLGRELEECIRKAVIVMRAAETSGQ